MNLPRQLDKVETIERSISCFELGLLSLLPVIGLPMAVRSLFQYFRVHGEQAGLRNPVCRLRQWGLLFAALGAAEFVVILLAIAGCIASSYLRNNP
jgi:hypothetical protein